MTRRIGALLVLLALALLPAAACAYWDYDMQLALMDDELPVIYGTLNQRMATRTGPATEYPEPGTFFAKGDRVRIISVAFDENNIPWVQVDLTAGRKHMRVYTGFKRIADVKLNSIPREFNYGIEQRLTQDYEPMCGPGTNYSAYGYTLRKGRTVIVQDYENGYAMCDFYSKSDDRWNRVWIPEWALE